MIRGYARVSTLQQDLDVQIAELRKAGADRLYQDKLTGANTDRPGLKKLLRDVQPGDVLMVCKLDRLGRSTRDVLNLAHDLEARGVQFRSLRDSIDTTTAMGRCFFQISAAFAELERSFIVERTTAGRQYAKAQGVKFGRRPKLTAKQIDHARFVLNGDLSSAALANTAELLGVHRTTLYRALTK